MDKLIGPNHYIEIDLIDLSSYNLLFINIFVWSIVEENQLKGGIIL